MIEKGTYVELAKANATAIQGLQPKISVWNTGAEAGGEDGGGRGDPSATMRNVYQMLPPLMSTIVSKPPPPAPFSTLPNILSVRVAFCPQPPFLVSLLSQSGLKLKPPKVPFATGMHSRRIGKHANFEMLCRTIKRVSLCRSGSLAACPRRSPTRRTGITTTTTTEPRT